MKSETRPIVALGVYDAPMAAWADAIGFDVFVIGNSGPMSLFGHARSPSVRPEELLFMTQAVSRVARWALIVATMPYLSYVASRQEAVKTAGRLIAEGGADCVQCHGNQATAAFIRAIVEAGIPVLAHIGLQSVRKTEQSGYGLKGGSAREAKQIVDDARALEDAGVFAFIVEHVPTQLAHYLAGALSAPVLSLGSGRQADGVYLVSADLTGYSVFRKPATADQFVDVKPLIEQGLSRYAAEARAGEYPSDAQVRHMTKETFLEFQKLLGEVG